YEVSNKAILQLNEFQQSSIVPSPLHRPNLASSSGHNKCWSPPPRGSLKINVDAHLSSDGHWFSGLILRREDGSAVGA
ncbi:hypothetical protein A2U01_0097236, partial [Trifolium medium]|nr:hypothetical protein [Trifolium medium]